MSLNSIALTGSSGFVGRHFSRLLRTRGVQCTELSRADLSSSGLSVRLRSVPVVVHLAARAHVLRDTAADRAAEFRIANVDLTANLAEASVAAGVTRFVYVSSAGVLGRSSPPAGFTDDSEPNPHDEYTASKLEAERSLSAFASRLQVVVLRPPLVYGPDAPGNFARMATAVRAGVPLPVGRLDAERSMVSVRNLCDALLAAAVARDGCGEPMLICDSERSTVPQLIELMAGAIGKHARLLNVSPRILRRALGLVGRGDDFSRLAEPFVLRPTRAAASIGWSPGRRLQDEIVWTMRSISGSTAR
jgi:UDP-glucose 4-epimerase